MSTEVKPGYKLTEVGVIPVDWEVKMLKQISPTQSVGLVINPSSYYDDAGTVPMLVGSNVSENVIDWASSKRISELSNSKIDATRVFAGDLVTVRVGEPGVTAVIPKEIDGCNCASMMIIRRHTSFDSTWLCCLMNSKLGRTQVENVQYGTAQKQFNISDAVCFSYPVPPLLEQRAIATALSDMDALISGLDQLIAKKRDIKQAIMQQLLTGKQRLPGFNGEWEVKRLGEIGKFLKGSGVRRDQSLSGDLPCIRYGEIYTAHNDYIREFKSYISVSVSEDATLIECGDIMFAGSGETKEDIGKCVALIDDIEAYAGGDIVILRPKNVDSLFLGYALNTPRIRRQKTNLGQGDAVVHISANALATIEILIPDQAEQSAIANVLADMDNELANLETHRSKIRQIKLGAMQQLLSGKIRLAFQTQQTPSNQKWK